MLLASTPWPPWKCGQSIRQQSRDPGPKMPLITLKHENRYRYSGIACQVGAQGVKRRKSQLFKYILL